MHSGRSAPENIAADSAGGFGISGHVAVQRVGVEGFPRGFREVVECGINRGRRTDKIRKSGQHDDFTSNSPCEVVIVVIGGGVQDFGISLRIAEESRPAGSASRKDSGMIAHTAAFIAEVRGVSPEELLIQTDANARQLFRLP